MKTLVQAILVFIVLATAQSQTVQRPLVHLTLRITDEEGRPIAGAMGVAAADIGTDDDGKHILSEDRGFSDTNGWVHLQVRPINEISFGAEKKGFYRTCDQGDLTPTHRVQFEVDKSGWSILKDVTNTVVLRPI
jgi:hypothetical protein